MNRLWTKNSKTLLLFEKESFNLIISIMKIKLFSLILIILALSACIKENEDLVVEIPKEIIRTKLDSVIYPQIVTRFPEYVNAMIKYPQLFSDTVQKQIVLLDSSEVYITFVGESATYKNTVGWYAYNISNPPTKIQDINLHVLFPNVSGKGEGGELLEGDMLQLRNKKFPKGTVIGFFLIVNGWNNGTINYSNLTHYTEKMLNNGSYHYHILYKDKGNKNIILGFEDMSYDKADKDYNDILFIVSDNKEGFESIYFDLNKIPLL